MSITINTEKSYTNALAFKNNKSRKDNTNSQTAANETLNRQNQNAQKKKKGLFANIAYGWINFAEGVKGLLKGLIYGFLAGTAVAGFDMIRTGTKKYDTKQISFKEVFNYKKAMSKTGKILSFVAAGTVFASNLIIARLKANKRTSNVDHMLYSGHRNQ